VVVSYTIKDANTLSDNGVLSIVVSPLAPGMGPSRFLMRQ